MPLCRSKSVSLSLHINQAWKGTSEATAAFCWWLKASFSYSVTFSPRPFLKVELQCQGHWGRLRLYQVHFPLISSEHILEWNPELSCWSFKEVGGTQVEEAEGKVCERFKTTNVSHLMQEEVVFLTYCQFSRNQEVTVCRSPNPGSQVWTPAPRSFSPMKFGLKSRGADSPLSFHSFGKMQKRASLS